MRFLWTPKWLAGHVGVLVICLACVALGTWQLDRLGERRISNQVHDVRYNQPPVDLDEALVGAGSDIDSLEYRHVRATGIYDPSAEVLIRSQVRQSKAGFDVVTPLRTSAGVLLVNRGWVPLEFDTPPVVAAPPPEGNVTVEGVVRLAKRDASVPDDATGAPMSIVTRIDIAALDRQIQGDLIPFYLVLEGAGTVAVLPVPEPPPNFSDDGPHLNYAIQWFSFALVGILGYGFLIRRALRKESAKGESRHDLDVGQPDEVGAGQADLRGSGSRPDHH